MTKKQFVEVLPTELRERLAQQFGWKTVDSICEAWYEKRATTFRRNQIKCSEKELRARCLAYGVTVIPIQGVPDAYQLLTPDSSTFFHTPLVSEGCVYVQSISSMLPVLALDPQKGENILDLCAAPGSKTTQIASITQNESHIVATDLSRVRIYKLEANLKTQGVTCVTPGNVAGETIWQTYPEFFDKTLVDVPCSMEGTIQSDSPASWEEWSPKKPKVLENKQRWLLRSGISATKPGGIIVYSTCTLSPNENEGVVDWILKKEKGSIELVDPEFNEAVPVIPGSASWKEKIYASEITKTKRILPSPLYEGFFIAKFRKIASSVGAAYLK
jgi:16S rRNA (cytosine1407-C5)-methyltransferase